MALKRQESHHEETEKNGRIGRWTGNGNEESRFFFSFGISQFGNEQDIVTVTQTARLVSPRQTWSTCASDRADLCIPLDPLSDPVRNTRLHPLSGEKTGLRGEAGWPRRVTWVLSSGTERKSKCFKLLTRHFSLSSRLTKAFIRKLIIQTLRVMLCTCE